MDFHFFPLVCRGSRCRGHDCIVVGFTTTCAIGACSWRDVLDTTICNKICQWFSPGTPVTSTNKTDHHNITEILLKVALNTINHQYVKLLDFQKS